PVQATLRLLLPGGLPAAGARVDVSAVACDQIYSGMSDASIRQMAEQFKAQPRSTSLGHAIGRTMVLLPEAVSRRLTGQTDGRGMTHLQGFAEGDVAGVNVTAAGYGNQSVLLNLNPNGDQTSMPVWPKAITLQPAGKVSGRLIVAGKESVRGVSLRVSSRH